MNRNKKYWLFLDGHTHCFVKDHEVLFYNSLNGKVLKNSNPKIIELGKQLLSKENLHVIEIDQEAIAVPDIAQFITNLRGEFMGDLIDTALTKEKPVQMMPMVKLDRDIKYLQEHPMRSVGDFLMNYLSELNIFLNGDCQQDCSICSYAYRQSHCCTKKEGQEISWEKLQLFLMEAATSTILNFNLYGGNILQYSHLKELTEVLNESPATKKLHIHYSNLLKADNLNLFQKPGYEIKLIVPVNNDADQLSQALQMGQQYGLNLSVIFFIESEEDYLATEQKIKSLSIENYSISPLFNGNNSAFFEENIFLEEQDICESKPSSKDIYAREKINTNFFGKLFLLSNGDIHANVNHEKLGVLGQDTLAQILYSEMETEKSWRQTRALVKPCSDCAFEKLCPSISPYEEVMERYNMCHIKG
jgi:pseudo-rSAM protein